MENNQFIIRWTSPDEIRFYETPLGTLRSVTSYLKVLAKPALINWAANTTAEYIKDKLIEIKEGQLDIEAMDINEIVRAAKQHHKEKLEAGGKRGTDIHYAINEYWATGIIPDETIKENEETAILFQSFLKWQKECQIMPISHEQTVYSKHGYAGTLDLFAEVNKYPQCSEASWPLGSYIIDYKTGKAIYDEAKLQVAAYLYALQERGPLINCKGIMIVRFYPGNYEIKVYDRQTCRRLFTAFLHLVKYVNTLTILGRS